MPSSTRPGAAGLVPRGRERDRWTCHRSSADAAASAGVTRFVLISAHRADEDFGDDTVLHLLRAGGGATTLVCRNA
jgi:hypothetical protein